jgi:accessory gene regulator B
LFNLLPVVFLIILSITTGDAINYVKAMLGFALLRQISGGYHIEKAEICVVVSTLSIFLIANYSYLLIDYVNYINIISFLLVLIFSPSNIEEQTRVGKKYHFVFKIL